MNCENCARKVPCEKQADGKLWCKGCVPGTRYITYPESREYFKSGALFRIKPETVPSIPPWTTWNGVLMPKSDSKYAQWLKQMDPHWEEGFTQIKGEKSPNAEFIRGLWTASKAPEEYCVKATNYNSIA